MNTGLRTISEEAMQKALLDWVETQEHPILPHRAMSYPDIAPCGVPESAPDEWTFDWWLSQEYPVVPITADSGPLPFRNGPLERPAFEFALSGSDLT